MSSRALDDDPFARMAAALPAAPPPAPRSRPRPIARRSRPSFSDLAPVLPPTFDPVLPEAPPVYPPTIPPAPIPFVPSVIVADDPAPVLRPQPQPRSRVMDAPTVRGRQRLILPHGRERLRIATVLALLCVSIAVFGIGIASFVVAKSRAATGVGALVTHYVPK